MTATKERILLSKDLNAIQEELTFLNNSKSKINAIIGLYNSLKIKLSDEQYNDLIKSNFSSDVIKEIATKITTGGFPAFLKTNMIQQTIILLNEYKNVFNRNIESISPNIFVLSGEANIDDAYIKGLDNQYSRFITDPDAISLYQKHDAIIDDINTFTAEVNKHTGYTFYPVQLFPIDNDFQFERPENLDYSKYES